MDRRFGGGLRDRQEPVAEEPRAHPLRQLVHAPGVPEGGALLAAEEAEPAAGAELELGGAADGGDAVLAVAEEDEGAVDEPAEEVRCRRRLGRRLRGARPPEGVQ